MNVDVKFAATVENLKIGQIPETGEFILEEMNS